jgi:hypothetical protein
MAGKSLGHHLAEVNAFNARMNQAEEQRRMKDAQNSISKRAESARAATTLIGDLRAYCAMKRPNLMAAALTFGALLIPDPSVAQTNSLTIAFFEKHNVRPRNAAELRATVLGKTLVIKTLKSGAVERVYYGAQRVDGKGEKTKYKIVGGGIREDPGGVPRMLLIYEWHGAAYVCVDNVGDLDELGEDTGTCPYQIVTSVPNNHAGEK